MPRTAIPSYKRRDKLGNKIDNTTRAEAQLADFLAAKAAAKKPTQTRGALIEEILLSNSRRHGFSGNGRERLADFLFGRASALNKPRPALIEDILTSWAKRNGYKPKE